MATLLQRIIGNNTVAGIGDNSPPSDMEILQERLHDNNQVALKFVDDLLNTAATLPERIETAEEAGEQADTIKTMTATIKRLEAVRVSEKEPYLALTRAVDGFFKVPMNKIEEAKRKAQRPLTEYLEREAIAERKRREEESERLRKKAAEELAAAAELAKTNQKLADISMVEAGATEQQAAHVQQTAYAKPAELASARGVGGALGGLRTVTVGEITNRQTLDLEALRPYFTDDSLLKALNAFIKTGARELKGARIYDQTSAVVR